MSPRRTLLGSVLLALSAACAEPPGGPALPGLEVALAKGGAPYLPGEQQPAVESPATGTWAIYPMGAGQNLAQTFTPSENGWLGYLQLPVGCVSGVLLNVKIREGLDGEILYESNHAGLPEVVDGTFQLLQVFNPADPPGHGVRLHKRQTYAFELAAFPGPNAAGTTCGISKSPPGDSYAGGIGYYRDLAVSPTWLPLPNGLPTDVEDLPFITLVR